MRIPTTTRDQSFFVVEPKSLHKGILVLGLMSTRQTHRQQLDRKESVSCARFCALTYNIIAVLDLRLAGEGGALLTSKPSLDAVKSQSNEELTGNTVEHTVKHTSIDVVWFHLPNLPGLRKTGGVEPNSYVVDSIPFPATVDVDASVAGLSLKEYYIVLWFQRFDGTDPKIS